MKTLFLRNDFLKAINICNRFISLKPNLPVLNNIAIKGEKGKVEFLATNLETSIKLEINAKSEGSWEITTPAKILNEFVNSSSGENIEVEADKETLKVVSGNSKASIASIAFSEFPKLPENKGTVKEEVSSKELQELVSQIAFAASKDEGKPILTGILLKKEGDKILSVATDGFRLAKKEASTNLNFDKIVVPSRTLLEAVKVAAEMESEKVKLSLSEEENQFFIQGENFLLASRILDGIYPEFDQIIPKNFVCSFEIGKDKLSELVKATAVFAKDIGSVVKIKIEKNKMKISANTAQIGDAESEAQIEIKGEPLEVAFNSQYLLEGLSALKEETVKINLSGPLSPALMESVKDKSFSYIVMPVKVQN